jgi:putative transposase
MMPSNLPPWQLVYYYFDKWRKNGFWDLLYEKLSKQVRIKYGKHDSPGVGIIDSQSVKTTTVGGQRGYDAANG